MLRNSIRKSSCAIGTLAIIISAIVCEFASPIIVTCYFYWRLKWSFSAAFLIAMPISFVLFLIHIFVVAPLAVLMTAQPSLQKPELAGKGREAQDVNREREASELDVKMCDAEPSAEDDMGSDLLPDDAAVVCTIVTKKEADDALRRLAEKFKNVEFPAPSPQGQTEISDIDQ